MLLRKIRSQSEMSTEISRLGGSRALAGIMCKEFRRRALKIHQRALDERVGDALLGGELDR